jgi:multidrug efflux system membrane fusion protein
MNHATTKSSTAPEHRTGNTPAPGANPPPPSPPPRPRRHRTLLVMLPLIVIALGAVWWINHRGASEQGPPGGGTANRARGGGGRGGFGGANAPLPVGMRSAEKGDLHLYLNALGSVIPGHIATLRTQVSGQLMQVAFQEGQLVNEGDLLAVIDPRPFQNALEQAQAQLQQARAQLATAKDNFARYEKLAKEDSIAQQQVDTTRSQVQQFEGLVQAAQAAIDTAKLNLTYCYIKAPFAGRVGMRQVDSGNYVTPGDANGIVVLTQVKPITVVFTLPEDNVAQVSARLRTGAKLPVDAFNRMQTKQLATGTLVTVDNQIDPTTGTFKLRAEFANDDESLFPNQFVNVRLLVDTIHDATIVPASAIERGVQGAFVYLVDENSTAVAHPVKLGATEGERVQVVEGLSPGNRVVTDGADKLKDGQKVILNTPGERAGPSRGGAPGGEEKRGKRGGKKASAENHERPRTERAISDDVPGSRRV